MNNLIYLSGGISGMEREEYTKRFVATAVLAAEFGFEPINPLLTTACPSEDCNDGEVEAPHPGHRGYFHTWACYLKYDLRDMLLADSILMLPDWRKSKGATLEFEVALKTNMAIYQTANDFKSFWEVYP